jgi:divalent metal cation (Fe/Co/Zn/Cd) transporter
VIVAAGALACDLPRDPEGTLGRARGGTLRVGAVEAPPYLRLGGGDEATGPEADLVRAFAESIGARVEWSWGALDGRQIWSGWIMVGVLFLSGIPPMVLSRMKLEPARRLHHKTLKADADMNKSDWLTAAAGMVGILGIGTGWWWADAVAGGAISLSTVKDGVTNLKQVVADLMDARPATVDGEISATPERVRVAVAALPWVADVEVRLREEGHLFAGELFVTARSLEDLAGKIEVARRAASSVDWRVQDVVVEIADGAS